MTGSCGDNSRAQRASAVPSMLPAKINIREQHVDRRGYQTAQRVHGVARDLDLKALFAERFGNPFGNKELVLDHENTKLFAGCACRVP